MIKILQLLRKSTVLPREHFKLQSLEYNCLIQQHVNATKLLNDDEGLAP
jgi:hypothetical protein